MVEDPEDRDAREANTMKVFALNQSLHRTIIEGLSFFLKMRMTTSISSKAFQNYMETEGFKKMR